MLDPRSGSIFLGGILISPICRLDIADFAGTQIGSISAIYRRYIDNVEPICRQLAHATFSFARRNTCEHTALHW